MKTQLSWSNDTNIWPLHRLLFLPSYINFWSVVSSVTAWKNTHIQTLIQVHHANWCLHMLIHPRLHSRQWLTRGSVITSHFVTSRLWLSNAFHFLALGLTLGLKFTKIVDDLLHIQVYHPAEFHRPASTHAENIRYKNIADKERKKERKKQ